MRSAVWCRLEELPDEEVGSRELDDDLLASYQKQFNY